MTLRMLVLFDIDGTLLSSASAGRSAIDAAFAAEYQDRSFFDQVRFDGKTDPQIVRELHRAAGRAGEVTDEEIEQLLQRYLVHLARELELRRDRIKTYPGVFELIEALVAEGDAVVGLLTGNIEPGAHLKLGAAGFDIARFVLGAYGSDSAHRADLPAIALERAERLLGHRFGGAEVVIIGDTPADVTCGAAIRARSVAVATGSYREDELTAAGADAVFSDLGDTAAAMAAILGSRVGR